MASTPTTSLLENQFIQPIIETLTGTVQSILEIAPKVLIGIVLFFLGLLFFKLLRRILVKFMEKVGLDKIGDKIGLGEVLGRFGIRSTISEVLGAVLFYLLMFHFLVQLALALELTMISDPLVSIVAFLPNVITATIVFITGFLVTDLIRRVVLKAAEGMGLDYARTLSTLLYGFLLVMVTTLAVKELGIDTALIETTVSILLCSLGLAMAIALGFGLQGLARNVVSGAYARDSFTPGSKIQHEGEFYTVSSVGAVSTRIEHEDGSFVMVPNCELVNSPVKGRG